MGLPIESKSPVVRPTQQNIRKSIPSPSAEKDSGPRDTFSRGGEHAEQQARELEEQRVKLFVLKNRARGQDVGMRRDGNGILRAQWNSAVPGTKQPVYFASEQHKKDSVEFLKGEAEGARDLAVGTVKSLVVEPLVQTARIIKDPLGEAGKAVQGAKDLAHACSHPRETAAKVNQGLRQTYVQPFKDGNMRAAGNVTGKAIVVTAVAGYSVSGFRPGQGVKANSKRSGNAGSGKISSGSGKAGGGSGSSGTRGAGGTGRTPGSSASGSARQTGSAGKVSAKVKYTLDHGTKIPDDSSITSLLGTATKKIGDFTNLKGATIPQLVARVPKNAVRAPWAKVTNGAEKGIKFQWSDASGKKWELRIHGPDPSAPAGSNASQGWVYRLSEGNKYRLPDGKIVHKNAHKPTSPNYAPDKCNESHIPVKGNPVL